jgi:hypothetical protein
VTNVWMKGAGLIWLNKLDSRLGRDTKMLY